jgi:peptide/nickel transport system substrate-binding protein
MGSQRRMTRRQFVRRAGGAAIGSMALGPAASLLAACTSSSSSPNTGTGTSGAAPPLKRDPGTLVLAVDAWTPDFDPASAILVALAVSAYGMYEGLVRMKPGSATEVEPVLATSLTSNADKSVWTAELRPGVKYSDGSAFDAKALKAAYTRTIEAGLGGEFILGTYITKPDKQIVVKDPGTVVFDLGSGVPRFDLLLASQYGCLVVNPKVLDKGPNFGHPWLLQHSEGTGAYMVDTFEPNNQLVMVQNPHYWRGWSGNHFKKVIIQQVEEGAVRRQGIESGDFDLAYAGTPQDSEALRHTPGVVVGNEKDIGMEYIILGEYGPLASPGARRAMNLLFPQEEFLNSVMKGALALPTSVLPDLMLYCEKGTYSPKVDVPGAKQLLQQAGVQPGTELTYEYYPGFRKEPGLVLQQQVQQVGLELKLVEKAFDAFSADLSTDRPVTDRANMYYWSWWPDYNDPSDYLFPILSEDATPKDGLYNSGYYINDTVNKTINDGYTESNPDTLQAMWTEAQTIMGQDDPPWIPVGQVLDLTYLRSDITGYQTNPLYIQTYDFYALGRSA